MYIACIPYPLLFLIIIVKIKANAELATSDHCETNFYSQHNPARENQEHLGTFMNTTPAVAYFLSNSNTVR
jgi:hypothetical protein